MSKTYMIRPMLLHVYICLDKLLFKIFLQIHSTVTVSKGSVLSRGIQGVSLMHFVNSVTVLVPTYTVADSTSSTVMHTHASQGRSIPNCPSLHSTPL